MRKIITVENPELAKEWDYEKMETCAQRILPAVPIKKYGGGAVLAIAG